MGSYSIKNMQVLVLPIEPQTDTATVNITVNGTYDPVAVDDSGYTTAEDTVLTIPVDTVEALRKEYLDKRSQGK